MSTDGAGMAKCLPCPSPLVSYGLLCATSLGHCDVPEDHNVIIQLGEYCIYLTEDRWESCSYPFLRL